MREMSAPCCALGRHAADLCGGVSSLTCNSFIDSYVLVLAGSRTLSSLSMAEQMGLNFCGGTPAGGATVAHGDCRAWRACMCVHVCCL